MSRIIMVLIYFMSTSLIDGGASPPAPLSGFVLKNEFRYPNPQTCLPRLASSIFLFTSL